METKLTPESAFEALNKLLAKIMADLGPAYQPRVNASFRDYIKNNEVSVSQEASTTNDKEGTETKDRMEMDPSFQSSDCATSSEEESSGGEGDSASSSESGSPQPGQKRQKKTQPKANKKKKDKKIVQTSITAPSTQPKTTTTAPNQPVKQTTSHPASKPESQEKSGGIPPIFCFSANIAEINRYCRGNCIKVIYKNQNTKKTIINCDNRSGFDKLKQFLKERKIQFNTFTPREERKNLLLLKGVHYSFSAVEVEDELRIEGLPIVKVTQFNPKKAGKLFNHFVVEVNKNFNIKDIYAKTRIMDQTVHWERLKPNDIVQCRNCQRFGHVATNCGRNFVCVKCKEEHLPGKCKRTANTGLDVWCAYCQKEGHPASFKGCPVLIAKRTPKNKIEAEKKARQLTSAKSVCTNTQPAVSFAAAVKGTATQNKSVVKTQKPSLPQPRPTVPVKVHHTPKPTHKAPINLNNEVQKFFGSDLISVMTKAKSAVPSNYSELSDGEKSVALATFIFQICN